jgi:hypothetical protein
MGTTSKRFATNPSLLNDRSHCVSAIVVFNRGTDTSTVLSRIDATVNAHSSFKRPVEWPHESGFRHVLHSNGDTNRDFILTVLVFHVPR